MNKLNEIKIDVPKGMEAYLENNVVKFRPIRLTYENIATELFHNKLSYYIDDGDETNICKAKLSNLITIIKPTNCTSQKQAARILALNKLMNIAKYLNGDWKPNWNSDDKKYFIFIRYDRILFIGQNIYTHNGEIHFKTEELAKQAIEILGEETIKLALCTDW